MSFELTIARRYLFSREGGVLARIITIIAMLGVAIGVGALVCVISVFDGAQDVLFRRLIDLQEHATLAEDEGEGFTNYEALCQAIDKVAGVQASAPAILRPAGVLYQGNEEQEFDVIAVSGLDLQREARMSKFFQYIVEGRAPTGDKEIVLGKKLAERLGLKVGDEKTLFTEMRPTASGMAAKRPKLKIVGLSRIGHYLIDNHVAYVSLATAQRVFLLDDPPAAAEIRIMLDDPYNPGAVLPLIKKAVGPLIEKTARLASWQEIDPFQYENLRMQKTMLFLILMLIVVVAAFNIIGVQLLIVMRKTREVGILMSMGVTRRSIRRIFMIYGLIVGGLGTLIGTLCGLALCALIAHTNLIKPDETLYYFSRLPVEIKATSILIIVASAIAVCAAASILPAWRASRLEAVEALRYE